MGRLATAQWSNNGMGAAPSSESLPPPAARPNKKRQEDSSAATQTEHREGEESRICASAAAAAAATTSTNVSEKGSRASKRAGTSSTKSTGPNSVADNVTEAFRQYSTKSPFREARDCRQEAERDRSLPTMVSATDGNLFPGIARIPTSYRDYYDGNMFSGIAPMPTSYDDYCCDDTDRPTGEMEINARRRRGRATEPGAFADAPGQTRLASRGSSGHLTPAPPPTSFVATATVVVNPREEQTTRSSSSGANNETSRRLVVADPVNEEHCGTEDMPQAEEMDPLESAALGTRKQRPLQFWRASVLVVFLLATALVSLVLGLKGRESNGGGGGGTRAGSTMPPPPSSTTAAPSMSPSMSVLEGLLSDLPPSTLERLQDHSTPQWKGLDWLSRHPELFRMPQWRQIQLFALATFFYSFEGPNWREAIHDRWLVYDRSECYWYSGSYGTFQEEEGSVYRPYVIGHGEDEFDVFTHESSIGGIPPCNKDGEMQAIVLDGLQLHEYQPLVPLEMELLSSLTHLSLRQNGINTTIGTLFPQEFYHGMSNLKHLALFNNPLKGTVPTELALLTSLQTLELQGCSFTGTIPNLLMSQMSNLQILYMNHNYFTGSIPSEVGLMTDVVYLKLGSNPYLTGALPTEMGLMKSLKHIRIQKMKSLSGAIPTQLGLLSDTLEFLRIKRNPGMGGLIPTELSLLTKLKFLNFGWTQISGTIPTQMGRLTSMQNLYLEEMNYLTGPIPSEIGALYNNTRFYVQYNQHTGTIPSEFFAQTKLQKIRFQGNLLSGTLPTEIAKLTSLWYLHLHGNMFSGLLPTQLGLLPAIQELKADHNLFVGSLPSELAQLTLLSRLELHNTSISGPLPTELGLLGGEGGPLRLFTLSGTEVTGVVPHELCYLGPYNDSAKEARGLDFDCSDQLCGCDWCSCSVAKLQHEQLVGNGG